MLVFLLIWGIQHLTIPESKQNGTTRLNAFDDDENRE